MTNKAAGPATSPRAKARKSVSSTKSGKQVSLELRFLVNETCGLVGFVETISNRPHKTDRLRDWYFEQGEQAKLDTEICDKYSTFLDQSGDRYEAIDVSGRRMTLSQRIECMTVDCETLDDLLNKLRAILGPEDYDVVEKTYRYFQSFYQSRVWQPRYERLTAQLEEFRLGAQECKMAQKLVEVQVFMKTKWPAKIPLDIILTPLPAKLNSSHGDSIGKTQIVELIVEHTFADQAETVFHELCHALWGRKKDLAKVCQEFQKFNGETAYGELNEGLATALQKWFCLSTFPETDPNKLWYRDEVIDDYGRGLCPIVTEYLSEGRCFDTAFVQRASNVFAEKCWFASRAIKNTTVVVMSVEIYTGDISKLDAAMHKTFPRFRSLSWTDLSSEDFSVRITSPYSEVRRIVLLSPENIDGLVKQGLTREQIELLRQRKEDGTCLKVNESEIVFCFGKDPETQQAVFLDLLKKEQWPSPPCNATITP